MYAVNGCSEVVPIGVSSHEPRAAGASAQARFELERRRWQLRRRALLPVMTAIGVLAMTLTFLLVWAISAPWVAFIAGLAVLMGVVGFLLRLPADALFWDRGAQGERRTSALLEPLLAEGFVLLHDRRVPSHRENIDTLAVGPTGLFVIETKNLSGRVSFVGGRLLVGEQRRDTFIEQVYRQATTVQVALADQLNPLHLSVSGVLCIHGHRATFDRQLHGVHVVSGSKLRDAVAGGSRLLDDEQIQVLARALDERLPEPYSWE